MAEVVLELELLQSEHAGNESVDVEDVDDDQQEEQDGENVVEGLAKHRHDVGISHHFRKG